MENVFVALISAGATIIVGFLVFQANRSKDRPKTPEEILFTQYKELLTIKDREIDRKEKALTSMEKVTADLKLQVERAETLIDELRQDLLEERTQKELYREQLERMEEEYKAFKSTSVV